MIYTLYCAEELNEQIPNTLARQFITCSVAGLAEAKAQPCRNRKQNLHAWRACEPRPKRSYQALEMHAIPQCRYILSSLHADFEICRFFPESAGIECVEYTD